MKVINLWGGPCTGKSTTAAGLFYEMKKARLSVELVQEYAKDAIWEGRTNLLGDQLYILAKQHRRIARLREHNIDWVITDSPVALGLVYLQPGSLGEHFPKLVMELFSGFDNHNYLLERQFEYDPTGRHQKNEEEAREFDVRVTDLMTQWRVPVNVVHGGEVAVDRIMRDLFGTAPGAFDIHTHS